MTRFSVEMPTSDCASCQMNWLIRLLPVHLINRQRDYQGAQQIGQEATVDTYVDSTGGCLSGVPESFKTDWITLASPG